LVGGPTALVAESVQRYRERRVTDGVGRFHEPTLGAVRKFFVAETDALAEERARASWVAFTEHLTRLFRRYEIPPPNDPTLGGDFDKAMHVQAVVVGSPARIRDSVEELAAEGGVDYLVGSFSWGDLRAEEAMHSLDLFAEHVVTPLRAQ
jgi:alkanesulfonate monooxygenase SsuD/methylene tetrahydromethanopterin reductase-like flavin-dependent oxidoreductase (luciferase family)